MENHLRVVWRDNQPSIEKQSEKIIKSKLFRDLYDLINEYDLRSSTLYFPKEMFDGDEFCLLIAKTGHPNDYNVTVSKIHKKYWQDSRGYVKMMPGERKTLTYGSLEGFNFVFKQGNPVREQRRLINSNLSIDIRAMLETHSLNEAIARLSIPNEFQYYGLRILDVDDNWIIKSSFFDECQPRHPEINYVVTRIKKET